MGVIRGIVFHSDRGSQYASQATSARLLEYGMTASMSRNGNCWDNAPSESFFNSLKYEPVHGTSYATRADAVADLFPMVDISSWKTRNGGQLSVPISPRPRAARRGPRRHISRARRARRTPTSPAGTPRARCARPH